MKAVKIIAEALKDLDKVGYSWDRFWVLTDLFTLVGRYPGWRQQWGRARRTRCELNIGGTGAVGFKGKDPYRLYYTMYNYLHFIQLKYS